MGARAMTRVGLVGCVKSKRPSAAARDLYVSPLFVGRRLVVESTCDLWFILSALHGLVDPAETVEPYDETLVGASMTRKRGWSRRVLEQLDDRLGDVDGVTFEIHAGNDYCDFGLVEGLLERRASVERPAQGLTLGQQLAFYASGDRPHPRPAPSRSVTASDGHTREVAPGGGPRGKYQPLFDALASSPDDRHEMSFEEIEDLLDAALPTSARAHRPWWANDPSHSHAHAWLAAGFATSRVDLAREQVTFIRE